MTEKLAYRVSEAAQAIGVSTRTIYNLIENGKLTARKIGRATVIRADDLARLLQSEEVTKRAQS